MIDLNPPEDNGKGKSVDCTRVWSGHKSLSPLHGSPLHKTPSLHESPSLHGSPPLHGSSTSPHGSSTPPHGSSTPPHGSPFHRHQSISPIESIHRGTVLSEDEDSDAGVDVQTSEPAPVDGEWEIAMLITGDKSTNDASEDESRTSSGHRTKWQQLNGQVTAQTCG